jgi:photosystem II stability/assembly factor-like uncharacterized protein
VAAGTSFYRSNELSCNSDNHCVAVADSADVFYSNDGGVTWTAAAPLPDPWGSSTIYAVTCTSDTHCIAGGGDAVRGEQGQLWTTNTRGASWDLATLPSTGNWSTWDGSYSDTVVASVSFVTCADATHCIAGGSRGGDGLQVATSSDGGSTWAAASPAPLNAAYGSGYRDGIQAMACNPAGRCVITTGNDHVWTSSDLGAHWALVTTSAGIYPDQLSCPTADVCKSTDLGYGPPSVSTALSH